MAISTLMMGFRRILLAAMGTGAVASSCGGDSTDEPTDEVFGCEHPASWPEDVASSGGYVQCENGVVHRPAPETCSMRAMPDGVTAPYPELEPCATDADCTEMPDGFCDVNVRATPQPTTSACVYPCTSDDDCDAGYACFCDSRGGRCIAASCSSDSDCGDDPCILLFTDVECGSPVHPELFCRTNEGCSADAECGQGYACISGTCASLMNTCGRPFLVRGTERRAKATVRSDWCQVQSFDGPAAIHLEPELRAVLSKHFTESALMEHASIAAFARFTLELLSLGAPAALVAQAARAMADETEHARACFALAARYGRAEVGPSPLSAQGCLDRTDPVSIFATAFREACVGETLAAMAALETSRRARDPIVRSTLARIAEDEARHAELGWRFAAWMLQTSPPALKLELSRVVTDILATERSKNVRSSVHSAHACETVLSEHGCLSDSVLASVRDSTLSTVVVPCIDHLLGRRRDEQLASSTA